jgi:deoxyribodipyrimidine photo-lyase
MKTTIVWFRDDLRLDDHPALHYAANRGQVVPVFIWDPDLTTQSTLGGASRWWLHQSLQSLQKNSTSLGSPLVLRVGNYAHELLKLAQESNADQVAFCESISPDMQHFDDETEDQLNQAGIESVRHESGLLWPLGSVLTKTNAPYQVFTPFWKTAISNALPSSPLPKPDHLSPPESTPDSLQLDQLNLLPTPNWSQQMDQHWTPGETSALKSLNAFVKDRLENYQTNRNRLDIPGWSAMSPHIHFGEVSVRRIFHSMTQEPHWADEPNSEHFLREIGWREFAQHLLNHFPSTTQSPLRDQFRSFPWANNPQHLKAWQRGMTGYPVVDAAMRQLWAQGWMPNRARMIVASFLCKHLLISWKEGAEWFWDTLVDADLASNTLGWQWTAGCGADAAPYFRIFNPITQGTKFDPNGDYVRTWVPELAGLDNKLIHQPWEAPPLHLSTLGITLGETYPHPIVDHAQARQRALDAYETIKR